MNVPHRDQLHAEAIAEYRPTTLELRNACRWLANITERLETVRDGTPEHQRLLAMWRDLIETLRTARAASVSPFVNRYTNASTIDILDRLDALRDKAADIILYEHYTPEPKQHVEVINETSEITPPPAPAPPIVVSEIDAHTRSVVYANTEEEQQKRAEKATATMMQQLGKSHVEPL